jgi:hypothetical protein
VTDVVLHLQNRFENFMFWDPKRLTIEALQRYAAHIDAAGGGDLIWGYIDGTIRKICRPTRNQRIYYSGHKHIHGYRFQAVVTPDGLFSSVYGPVVGSHGDWYIFQESQLEATITEVIQAAGSRKLYIYGDPAYTGSKVTMGSYRKPRGGQLTQQQRQFNTNMSRRRISVEHGFGHVQRHWLQSSYHLNQRIGHTPVGTYYLVGLLLANIMTCLRGNQISDQFDCDPPTLPEYFAAFLI